MSKGRVFVVQDQKQVNRQLGRLESKFDFSPAKRFGELVFLLSPSAKPMGALEQMVDELHMKLEDFGDEDYLLLTGNPVLIGLAVTVAAHYNDGNVKMLQWSGKTRSYIPVEATGVVDCAVQEPSADFGCL